MIDLMDDENGCCTAPILRGLDTINYDNVIYHYMKDLASFKQRLRELVVLFNDVGEECGSSYEEPFENLAFVQATTSSRQKEAEEYFLEMGFQRMGPYPSKKYAGTSVVSMWVIPVDQFLKAIAE